MLDFFEVYRFRSLAEARYEGFVSGWNLFYNRPLQNGGKSSFLDALFLWNSCHAPHYLAFQYGALGYFSAFDQSIPTSFLWQGEGLFPELQTGEEGYLRFFGGNAQREKRVAFVCDNSRLQSSSGVSNAPYLEIVYFDRVGSRMWMYFQYVDKQACAFEEGVWDVGYLREEGVCLVTRRGEGGIQHEVMNRLGLSDPEWLSKLAGYMRLPRLATYAQENPAMQWVQSPRTHWLLLLLYLVETLPSGSLLLVDNADMFRDHSPYWEGTMRLLGRAVQEKGMQLFLTARDSSGIAEAAERQGIAFRSYPLGLVEASDGV